MSNTETKNKDKLDLYLKSALSTNLYFLKVRIAINITATTLMFISSSYLLYKIIFGYENLDIVIFIKELIFLVITPMIFKLLATSTYNNSRFEYYESLTQNKNE